jgi:hypothetical protein
MVGTNVNFHYNGIPARVRWIRSCVDKPICFVDAATAHLLDRQYLQPPLYDESVYPYMTETEIGEILVQRDHAEHARIKAWWEKEKAKYTIKKTVIAASQGVENIGFQFMFDTMGSNSFWGTIAEMAFNIGCGLLEWGFDHEPRGTAKPAYYSLKLFDKKVGDFDSVIDLNPLPEGGNPTNWTWIIKFTKDNRDTFVLWSESGVQTLDLSPYFSTSNVCVTRIVTGLDENYEPVYPDDQTVEATSVPIDEVPIFVQERGAYHHVSDCTVCHYGLGGSAETSACGDSANLKMVRDEIVTPNSDTRPVVFTGSYVRGGEPYDGVCEVCHTDTVYHRNSALGDHSHYTGENCISCHPHKTVYAGKDIFSASDTGLASHDTHMMDQTKGPGSDACTDCHSASSPPAPGESILFADGNPLATTTACNTCHSEGGAYNGSGMAKTSWGEGVYESGSGALKEGQEEWCVSCHDSGMSVCQGVRAPNVELYYTGGHGRPDADVECLVCHDAAFAHIDGEPRSYWFNDEDVNPADDNADMYDVANSGVAYAAGYRLRYIDGKVPMMIPAIHSYTFDNNLDLSEMKSTAYRRCFNAGCHNALKIFSEGIGIYTNFTAREPDPPYSYSAGGEDRNLHAYHLTRGIAQWDSDWDIGTDTLPETEWGNDSVTSCPTCHNVHGVAGTQGSTNDTMVRDGSLVGRSGFGFSFVIEDTAAGGYPWVTSEGATASTSVGSIFRNGTGNNEMCFGCHGVGGPSNASFIAENVPVVYSGYHAGLDSQDTLTVAGSPWAAGELVGKYIRNVTDGSYGGTIVANTVNTATSDSLCCGGSGAETPGRTEMKLRSMSTITIRITTAPGRTSWPPQQI